MSAVLASSNDDMSMNAWNAVRTMPGMTPGDVRVLLAAAIGQISSREGSMVAAQVCTNALRAARRDDVVLSLAEIAFVVATKHGITVEQMREPSSTAGSYEWEVSHPRQEAFWLARAQRLPGGTPKHGMAAIGRYFGDRDHTTVLYGIRKHRDRLLAQASA